MKILYIIGNGFDINLGMNTQYTDFYKYYQSIKSQSVNVNDLKKSISSNIKNWADLELSLGDYTENIKSVNEFDEVYEDIGDKLSDYLGTEENNFDFTKVDLPQFFNYLCKPENSLPIADRNQIIAFKELWNNKEWNIKIMTLNYTRTIEKLLKEKTNGEIGIHHNSHKVYLKGIEHIHGYIDERMIMGVNDTSQIKNTKFHDNQEVIEAIVKTNCNGVYKHAIEESCFLEISSANLICVFGSSIGDSDNIWWELIGEQLKRDCQLIIFSKGEEINPRIGYKKARIERGVKNHFLGKTKLNEQEKLENSKKIFVINNSNMFSNICDNG